MHFQTFLEEPNKLSSYQQLQQQINEQKEQKVKSDIQNLENIWVQWFSQQQLSQKQNDDTLKKNESIDIECTQEANAVEKSTQLKNFFEILKSRIINEKLYSTMTQTQMTQFFEEATTQIQNKIKLYEDIQKLKLLQNYPSNTKRTYSKSANMTLKKWLIENYNNPYPKPHQGIFQEEIIKMKIFNFLINFMVLLKQLKLSILPFIQQITLNIFVIYISISLLTNFILKKLQQTNLTNKQVLNWFINARNSLKNKSADEKKFKHIVECKFKELAMMKKKKIEQSI